MHEMENRVYSVQGIQISEILIDISVGHNPAKSKPGSLWLFWVLDEREKILTGE